MVTESGALVVILLEAMRHVDLEALFLELHTHTHRDPLNPQKAVESIRHTWDYTFKLRTTSKCQS